MQQCQRITWFQLDFFFIQSQNWVFILNAAALRKTQYADPVAHQSLPNILLSYSYELIMRNPRFVKLTSHIQQELLIN